MAGLSKYQPGGVMFGVTVKNYENAKKSFVTMKIDNVDMIESNLRILDFKGQLSSFGLVEFRVKGVWGSINAKGTNKNAVKNICKQMGYLTGNKVNGDTASQLMVCENYQGNDYCGQTQLPVHFTAIKCEDQDKNIIDCYREISVDQDHK